MTPPKLPATGYYIAAVHDERLGEMLRAVEVRGGKVIAPDGELLRAENCRHFKPAPERYINLYWPHHAKLRLTDALARITQLEAEVKRLKKGRT